MPSFRELIGQHRSLAILRSFLKKRDIPQSILFEGEAGVGKRRAAEIFSQAILCQDRSPATVDPCGKCLACQKIKNHNHPDFLSIAPDGSAIKINQIREMQGKIVYKPIDGPHKIIIIDPADKMNAASANGLLKTLEEPPSYAILILISAKGASLLPTLRSRCQKIAFHPIPLSQIIEVLMKEKGWTKSEAHLVAGLSHGRLGEALSMEMDTAKEMEVARYSLLSNHDLFETAASFSGDSAIFESALSYLMVWFRDVLAFKLLSGQGELDPYSLVYAWRYDEIKVWASRMEARAVLNFLSDLQTVYVAQARNVNRQLSLETLLLRLNEVAQASPR